MPNWFHALYHEHSREGQFYLFNYLQKNKVQQVENGREGIPGSRSLAEALRLQGVPKRCGGVRCGPDSGSADGSQRGEAVVKVSWKINQSETAEGPESPAKEQVHI